MRNPFSLAEELFLSPLPLRVELLKILSRKFSLFSFKKRLEIEALYRPHLAYGMFNAAIQAKGLGIDEISVLEFGIYCGKALFFMEKHAKEIESCVEHPKKLVYDSLEDLLRLIKGENNYKNILFSPGYPSGDDFSSFIERGEYFNFLVKKYLNEYK